MKPKTVRPTCTALTRAPDHRGIGGFAYVEVLVATLLIATTLVPALDALRPGTIAADIQQRMASDQYSMLARFEEVMAAPFAELQASADAAGNATVPSSYSDTVVYGDGRQIVRNVYLSGYDGDNADGDGDPFTGKDAGLLWVKIEIAGTRHRLEGLTSVYD
ncbi:MAG: hypothetical protein ACWGNB_03925 [Thiogranum sp.]